MAEWSTEANDAIHICLKSPLGQHHDKCFHPTFTYSIYGDEESIFGYKGLRIALDFAGDTLQPTLNITWKHKFEAVGDVVADEEVESKLLEYLPTISKDSPAQTSETPFEPPGTLVHSYAVNGQPFGIWSSPLTDLRTKQIIKNMQIFVPFYIEGGTCIELDDPDWTMSRWRVFLIYAMHNGSDPSHPLFTLIGYSTSYRLFFLPPAPFSLPTWPSEPTPLPNRMRISQFLILPPFQSSSHGSNLYGTMIKIFLSEPTCHEITLEDPNESFDDLRDINDLLRLSSDSAFTSLSINTATKLGPRTAPLPTSTLLPREELAALRTAHKLAPRQFARLVEMHLLRHIPPLHRSTARITRKERASDPQDRAYYFWRLLVKQRLYKHNADALAELEGAERIEKVEEALSGVERDYGRLLEVVERRTVEKRGIKRRAEMVESDEDELVPREVRKRTRVLEDEDEEEEEEKDNDDEDEDEDEDDDDDDDDRMGGFGSWSSVERQYEDEKAFF